MKTKLLMRVLVCGMLTALFFGCKKENQNGYMTVKLTDAPGNYLHVNVDVRSVDVHYSNGPNWVTLNTNAGVYDLLSLQNNVMAVLANNTMVPAGKVTQMRLILGSNNSVVLASDSTTHDLTVPGSYNSGVKINVDATIPGGQTMIITLDFDAEKSVNKTGNGEYVMNPVIRTR
ncbi:MAG: DUF4382 domain-containing protein [Bacteroidia bacterium]